MMDRRTVLAGTGAVLLAAPLAAEAQSIPRIGSLELALAPPPVTPVAAGILTGAR